MSTSSLLLPAIVLLGLAVSCGALRPEFAQTTIVSTPNETPCDACTQLVALAKAYMANPTTQQRIMNFVLEDVCPKLPEADRQYCTIYAPLAVAAASGWIQSRQATDVCGQAGLCAVKGHPLVNENSSPSEKYAATLVRCPAFNDKLAEASVRHAPALRDNCDTCKIAVTEAAAILADPGTQKEVLDYAKQACDVYPDFHDQCLTYVEMYGPLVINAAVAYMTPELCAQWGICAGS